MPCEYSWSLSVPKEIDLEFLKHGRIREEEIVDILFYQALSVGGPFHS